MAFSLRKNSKPTNIKSGKVSRVKTKFIRQKNTNIRTIKDKFNSFFNTKFNKPRRIIYKPFDYRKLPKSPQKDHITQLKKKQKTLSDKLKKYNSQAWITRTAKQLNLINEQLKKAQRTAKMIMNLLSKHDNIPEEVDMKKYDQMNYLANFVNFDTILAVLNGQGTGSPELDKRIWELINEVGMTPLEAMKYLHMVEFNGIYRYN